MKKILPWVCGLCLLALAMAPGLGRANALPEKAHISGLTGHAQSYGLSCESRSAVDWAAFWGVQISEWEFLSSLPVTDNPDTGFVGSYNGLWGSIPPNSYGVHARPVAALLRQYGLQAKARRNMSWNDLRAEIAGDRPVIVWIIGAMWPGTPVAYTSSDGHNTTVASYEHTMLVSGYDSASVYAIDASTGIRMSFYRSTFLDSWKVLGNMAVTGQGPESHPKPTRAPAKAGRRITPRSPEKSYTVHSGDYLIALAKQFDTPWQELARLNNISYPYTVFAGQVLKLPSRPITITHQVYMPLMWRKGARKAPAP
jgi:uncharacterized protein YvpB